MSNETEFVDGLVAQEPREGAPDFIKGKLWIKRKELVAWLQARSDDSINVDIKVSKGGKWYASVDSWKPNSEGQGKSEPARQTAPVNDFTDDDIPDF